MRSIGRSIAIVGGGFSGTVLAANLLRRASAQPTRIVLIEARAEIGRGVAFQDDRFGYLLNVPAARMSAQSDEPLQFAQFAQQHAAGDTAELFLPRELYGRYLQQQLQIAVQQAAPHISLERVQARANAIYRIEPTGPYLVSLSTQQRVLADDVVLACGDPPPENPPGTASIAEHPAYVCNPYSDSALRPETQTLLLIGSGLTMADVALRAAALNPNIQIHSISRHGLLPAAQPAHSTAAVTGDLTSRLGSGPVRATVLLRQFRSLLGDIQCRGGDWRDAVNVARHGASRIWSAMSFGERARFLRHLRVYWDVHRHRMPPKTDAALTELRRRGQLHVHAGRLLPMELSGNRLAVRWRERATGTMCLLEVDRVVNCAGTDRRLSATRDPLMRGLMDDGLAVVEPLGLGWRLDAHSALIDRYGASSGIFYLGPMLRAQHWEATAVGELRGHAERLADALTARSRSCTNPPP